MPSLETGWPLLDFYSAWLRWTQAMLRSAPWSGSDLGTTGISVAPQVLSQPINPGWIFGNVSITNENSGDPEAERRIMEAVSYGRQLGRIMDAVAVLVAQTDRSELTPEQQRAFDDFREIQAKIKALKAEAASRWISDEKITELAKRLKRLERSDPEAYERLTGILRSALEI